MFFKSKTQKAIKELEDISNFFYKSAMSNIGLRIEEKIEESSAKQDLIDIARMTNKYSDSQYKIKDGSEAMKLRLAEIWKSYCFSMSRVQQNIVDIDRLWALDLGEVDNKPKIEKIKLIIKKDRASIEVIENELNNLAS